MEGYLHGAEVNFRRLTSEPLFSAFYLLYAWPKRFNGGLQGLNLKSDNFIRNPKNVIDAVCLQWPAARLCDFYFRRRRSLR